MKTVRKIKVKVKKTTLPLCACGCGQPVSHKNNKYILGHNQKTDSSANADHRWKPGQSGNEAGKKAGSRHSASIVADKMLLDEQKEITEQLISKAKNGHFPSLKLIFERLCPIKRSSPIKIRLPRIEFAKEMPKLTGTIIEAVAKGAISPGDADVIARLSEKHLRALESSDIESRLEQLELKLLEG